MRNYELTFLILPDLREEEAKSFQGKIVSQIQEIGGFLLGNPSLFKKYLFSPVKKKTSAFLSVLSFQLAAEKIEMLEKKLKSEANILRYFLMVKPKIGKMVEIPARKMPRRVPTKPKEKKVELEEIGKKLEEILGE